MRTTVVLHPNGNRLTLIHDYANGGFRPDGAAVVRVNLDGLQFRRGGA